MNSSSTEIIQYHYFQELYSNLNEVLTQQFLYGGCTVSLRHRLALRVQNAASNARTIVGMSVMTQQFLYGGYTVYRYATAVSW